jgi:ABC-type glycerol-3-phosphate transport system substrate-binding protein
MKKYTFILALGVMLTLAACGSGSTATETTDSTAVQADTTAVTADSTSAPVADTTAVK